jgi:hypothetical protein
MVGVSGAENCRMTLGRKLLKLRAASVAES